MCCAKSWRAAACGRASWPNSLWALGKIGYDDVDLIDGIIKNMERVSRLLPWCLK